jgi:hypothetical protein
VEVLAVQAGDRGKRMRLARHLHEAEALGCATEHVALDLRRLDLTKDLEGFQQVVLGDVRCQVADEDVHSRLLSKGL